MTATTWNPTDKATNISLTNGNLTAAGSGGVASWEAVRATKSQSTGKWYYEVKFATLSNLAGSLSAGFATSGASLNTYLGNSATGFGYQDDGATYKSGVTVTGTGSSLSAGDIIGVAIDFDAGKFWVAKNNTWLSSGSPSTGANPFGTFTANTAFFPAASAYCNRTTYGTLVLYPGPITNYNAPSGFDYWDELVSTVAQTLFNITQAASDTEILEPLLFIDGFDHESANADLVTKWNGQGGGGSTNISMSSATTPYGYGQSLQLVDANNVWIYKTTPQLTRIIAGCAFYPSTSNKAIIMAFSELTTGPSTFGECNVQITYDPTNQRIQVSDDVTLGDFGSTANNSVPLNTWAYVEVDITFNASTGAVKLNLNGVNILNLTALNTARHAAYCQSMSVANNNSGATFYVDDLYILNPAGQSAPYNAMLGPVRVQTIAPNANSSVTWTPNGAANNWQNVSTVPWSGGGTDYNSVSVLSDQDTFTNAGMIVNAATIFGAALTGAFKAASTDNLKQVLLSSGTLAGMAEHALTTGWVYYQDITSHDPHTTVAWTNAGIGAATFGYKQDTGSVVASASQSVLEVLTTLGASAVVTQTLKGVTQAISAVEKFIATVAQTLAKVSQAVSANLLPYIAQVLFGPTQLVDAQQMTAAPNATFTSYWTTTT